ncbi:hypothetical protein ACWIUD_08250 [Helicobacter sp. 23-1044]
MTTTDLNKELLSYLGSKDSYKIIRCIENGAIIEAKQNNNHNNIPEIDIDDEIPF